MPDNDKPSYELLLEKIGNLETEVSNLKAENSTLQKKVDDVTAFNRSLLNKPKRSNETKQDVNEKLNNFIQGD